MSEKEARKASQASTPFGMLARFDTRRASAGSLRKPMSPQLEASPRSKPETIHDIIGRGPTYLIVCYGKDGLYTVETDIGTSMGAVVYDLATEQFKHAVAVLYVSLNEKTQDVSEDVARCVIAWLRDRDRLHDGEGRLLEHDFLDYAWPDWRQNIYCLKGAA